MKLQVIDIAEGTSVDGPGLRTSIYFAGCNHRCEGCQNPQSWPADAGKEMEEDDLMDIIRYNGFDVTFSGGDPLFQAKTVAHLAKRIKNELGLNIWCYTGYRWEELQDSPTFLPLLQSVDVLVDSPFVLALRDLSLRFRGSSNQRIINVPRSLAQGSMVDITEAYN